MNRICFTFLFFVFGIGTFAQDNARFDFYTEEDRLSKFPFNKAKSVKLVSFGIASRVKGDASIRYLPMSNGAPDLSKMDEIVDIPYEDIDSISDILSNTCYRLTRIEWMPAYCYIPRNAIIFFDSTDTYLSFLEVCFGCDKMRPASPQFFLDSMRCNKMYSDLQKFFIRRGLKTSAIELTEELHRLVKIDNDPSNFIRIDKRKVKKLSKEFRKKYMRTVYSDKSVRRRDVKFLFSAKIRKGDKYILVDVTLKGKMIMGFGISFPEYRLDGEIIDLR